MNRMENTREQKDECWGGWWIPLHDEVSFPTLIIIPLDIRRMTDKKKNIINMTTNICSMTGKQKPVLPDE